MKKIKRKIVVLGVLLSGGGAGHAQIQSENAYNQKVQITNSHEKAKMNKDSSMLKEHQKNLDEVVVTAYGSMKRKDVSSSITTIKGDELSESP
ncbi:MAG: hypothetical protein ACRCR9_00785, partial [Chitinophagaceae bacterium]